MKDDFFDSLPSNVFDRSGQIERPRFSDQRRLDTEVSVDSLFIYITKGTNFSIAITDLEL